MANVTPVVDENENKVFQVDPGEDEEITLATANTYVDKNIIFQVTTAWEEI